MIKGKSKAVTTHLRQLAAEAESIQDDGTPITRAEALAMLLWAYALGWEEPDPDDPAKTVRHRPAQWAIQLLYDRLEGKAPASADEANSMDTTADRVSELVKNNINAMTLETVGDLDPKEDGPPTYRRQKDDE